MCDLAQRTLKNKAKALPDSKSQVIYLNSPIALSIIIQYADKPLGSH